MTVAVVDARPLPLARVHCLDLGRKQLRRRRISQIGVHNTSDSPRPILTSDTVCVIVLLFPQEAGQDAQTLRRFRSQEMTYGIWIVQGLKMTGAQLIASKERCDSMQSTHLARGEADQ